MSRLRPPRKRNLAPALALAVFAGLLAACSSASVTDMIPTAAGGLPTNTPARPAAEPEYPAVGANPPRREALPLTDEEVKRTQAELTTLRKQQEQRTGTLTAGAAPPAKGPEPAKKDATAKPAKKTKDAKPPAELTAKDPAK